MDELDEVLDIQQRQKRAMIIRRYKTKIERAREVAQRRMAPDKNIKKRAYAQARQIVRKRFAGQRGAEYEKLGPSEKMAIDRAIDKKQALIKKIALRLIPKVKQAEAKRLSTFTHGAALKNQGQPEGNHKVNEDFSSFFAEKYDDLSTNQLPDENKTQEVKKAKKGKGNNQIKFYNKFGEEVSISRAAYEALEKKSEKSGIDIDVLGEVYNRGRQAWTGGKVTQEQYAFARVNSFINQGRSYFEEDADLHGEELIEKRGLWDNIHAKRKRIKAGSGERMRKPGSKGAPTAQDFKDAQESVEIHEANKYSVHKGKEGWYVNQHTDNGVWNHSVQTGYHDSKNKAVAWAKKHAGNREHTIDIKEETELDEGTIHSVHVRTYDSKGEKQLNSKDFVKHVKDHGGELHYVSDKGVAFKFKRAHQANDFHRKNMSHFRDLGSENDGEMHESVEVDESKNTPYVRPHIEKGSTQQTAWKASNKHGKVKYFGMDFKKSAEKHAGISEECGCDEKESIGTKIRKKIEVVDRAPKTPGVYTKQAEIKNKIIDEEHPNCGTPECCGQCESAGNSQNDPAKRLVGTDSLVKAFKKDTPGQGGDLNESFNIAFAAGVGVSLTAADLGMKAQGGFQLHPSVIAEMQAREEEIEEDVASAVKKPVYVPPIRNADGTYTPAKTVMRKTNKKIIKGDGSSHDGN